MIDAVIGGDPGGKGCAMLITKEREISFVEFRHNSHIDTFKIFGYWHTTYDIRGFREDVGDMPGEGSSSTLQFGKNIQFLDDCMEFNFIPFEIVDPQVWQREFGVYALQPKFMRQFVAEGMDPKKAKGAAKRAAKREYRAVAQTIFPNVDMTLDRADATLIAEYGWRKTFGGLKHGKDESVIHRPPGGITRIVTSEG